jgi:hypothetical protein
MSFFQSTATEAIRFVVVALPWSPRKFAPRNLVDPHYLATSLRASQANKIRGQDLDPRRFFTSHRDPLVISLPPATMHS